MKKLLLAIGFVGIAFSAHATDLKIVCPSACTVTLPATIWDEVGGALNDAITVRQNLFSEIARQLREQMPAPQADPARSPEEDKPNEPPAK